LTLGLGQPVERDEDGERHRGDDPSDRSFDTVVPGESTPGTEAPTDAPTTPADGTGSADADPDPGDGDAAPTEVPRVQVDVVGVQAWDPDGTNATENDSQAGLALADGSASTAWPTECYSDKYLGGKRGVGLVLTLSAPSAGTLSVDALNGPYQLDVYATDADAPPGDLAGWQQIGDTSFAEQPETVTVDVGVAATHLLVWLKELGPDEACSNANPYRGRLGEISYVP
jgi:serine/threonine-protein kinase